MSGYFRRIFGNNDEANTEDEENPPADTTETSDTSPPTDEQFWSHLRNTPQEELIWNTGELNNNNTPRPQQREQREHLGQEELQEQPRIPEQTQRNEAEIV